MLAFLQGNIRHLPRRSINLIERSRRKRIDLNRIDVTVAGGLHACRGVGFFDTFAGVAELWLRTRAMQRLELAGKRQRCWNFNHLDWPSANRRVARPVAHRHHRIFAEAALVELRNRQPLEWIEAGLATRYYEKTTTSLPQLLRPIDGVDVNSKRILAQAIGIARCLDHNGEDCGPALGCAQASVLVSALNPGDTE